MKSEETTRREFVKISLAAGALGIAAATAGGCAESGSAGQSIQSTNARLDDIRWDGVFDVVVVGFGAAGASSAIAAADSGASVVLLDKAPEGSEGGNSRYATQLFVTGDDLDNALAYYQGLRGGFYAPDEVLKAYVDGLCNMRETLAEWGLDESRILDVTEIDIADYLAELS